MTLAPIVLFVYNRLWHTQQTVEALLKNVEAADSELIIFSDGGKDAAACVQVDAVRAYLRTIKGFKSIRIVEQEKNLGLAQSIILGVTDVVNEYGRVIVLEDDLETSPHFLHYMNVALDKYASEEQVMQISGHMFPVVNDKKNDMLFLPFTTTWGWATWKRAWEHFDAKTMGYQALKSDALLRKRFDLDDSFQYFHMLEKQLKEEIDSWGIRWYLSVFMQQGLTLYPSSTLVANIGMDGSGVHCGKSDFLAEEDIIESFVPKNFPEYIQVDHIIYKCIKAFLVKKNGNVGAMNKLKKIFNNFLKQ